jgi:hypothetical protein
MQHIQKLDHFPSSGEEEGGGTKCLLQKKFSLNMYGTAVYNIHILTPSYYEIISNHKPYFM